MESQESQKSGMLRSCKCRFAQDLVHCFLAYHRVLQSTQCRRLHCHSLLAWVVLAMSCPSSSWQRHRSGYRWSPVRTLPAAPLWCDLGRCSRTVVVIKLRRTSESAFFFSCRVPSSHQSPLRVFNSPQFYEMMSHEESGITRTARKKEKKEKENCTTSVVRPASGSQEVTRNLQELAACAILPTVLVFESSSVSWGGVMKFSATAWHRFRLLTDKGARRRPAKTRSSAATEFGVGRTEN